MALGEKGNGHMVSSEYDPGTGGSHISAIRAGSLREQVSRALEAALVAGELRPGEIYSGPALGERFNVSATPVREAMLDLVKDGFVEVVRNKGFRVVEMSDADLDQISQIRLLLEVPTMASLALSIPESTLNAMTAMADDIEKAAAQGDLIAYLDYDRRFHVELISTLENPRLTGLFGLNDLVQSGRLVASAREHHELLDLLRARDAEGTAELMTGHIKHTRGLWVGRDE